MTPSPPSLIDQRRLRDGARALAASVVPPETIDDAEVQLDLVVTGIAALQSLDDLGPEANTRAHDDLETLWRRHDALQQQLRKLRGKVT